MISKIGILKVWKFVKLNIEKLEVRWEQKHLNPYIENLNPCIEMTLVQWFAEQRWRSWGGESATLCSSSIMFDPCLNSSSESNRLRWKQGRVVHRSGILKRKRLLTRNILWNLHIMINCIHHDNLHNMYYVFFLQENMIFITVWRNQIGTVITEMSSWSVLKWNTGMKRVF